jgi:hypothetical protein
MSLLTNLGTESSETLFAKIEGSIEEWIQNMHSPTPMELALISHLLKKLKNAIKTEKQKDQTKIKTLERHVESLESAVSELQNDSEETKTALEETKTALKTTLNLVQELQDELKNVKVLLKKNEGVSKVIEAKSIASAAEIRFMRLILGDDADEEDLERYSRVNKIIDDYEVNSLPLPIRNRWETYMGYWESGPYSMRKIFDHLSWKRGSVAHREDRDENHYTMLSNEDVATALSGLGLRKDEIKLVVKLHELTITQDDNLRSEMNE